MDLTYRDVMDANFDGLTSAATQWRRMGRAFGTLRTDYTTHVGKRLAGWRGNSSATYKLSEIGTLDQFDKAKHQAASMAQLLENARDMLTDAREAVKAVRDAARDEGNMNVDEYGTCTLDTSKMSDRKAQAVLNDPDRADTERAWTNSIQRAVTAVGELDNLIMRSLKAAAADGDPGSGSVGFNGDAPKDFDAFATDLSERRAKKAEEARNKSVPLSTGALRGMVHGINTAARTPGGLGDKAVKGTVEGINEATGFNNTQGICTSFSAGIVSSAGNETCIVLTRKPNGGHQVAVLDSIAGSTAGWDFGMGGNIGFLKSNADDVDQLRGPGWGKGASVHAGPLGGEINHTSSFDTVNSKGEAVQSYFAGVGPGLETSANTGFTRTYGHVLTETSPNQK